jgi:hypothetical protein
MKRLNQHWDPQTLKWTGAEPEYEPPPREERVLYDGGVVESPSLPALKHAPTSPVVVPGGDALAGIKQFYIVADDKLDARGAAWLLGCPSTRIEARSSQALRPHRPAGIHPMRRRLCRCRAR